MTDPVFPDELELTGTDRHGLPTVVRLRFNLLADMVGPPIALELVVNNRET